MQPFKVTAVCVATAGLLIIGAFVNSERAAENTDTNSTQPETSERGSKFHLNFI